MSATFRLKDGIAFWSSSVVNACQALVREIGFMPLAMQSASVLFLLLNVMFMLLAGGKVVQGEPLPSFWTAPIMVTSLGVGSITTWMFMHDAYAARHVIMGRVAPVSALRSEETARRCALLLVWAGSSLPVALLGWPVGPSQVMPGGWIAGPSLLAVWMALCAIHVAAWHGSLPAVGLIAPLPLVTWLALQGWDQVLSTWRSPGRVVNGLLALILPWALSWLGQRLEVGWRLRVGARPPSIRGRVAAFVNRVALRWQYVDAGGGVFVLLFQLALQLNGSGIVVLVPSGGRVTVWFGLGIAACALFCAPALTARDLHWRWVLAPKSGFRSGLGHRVVGFTLLRLVGGLGAVAAVALPVALHAGASPGDVAKWSGRVALPMLNDLALGVAIAAFIRGRVSNAATWRGLGIPIGVGLAGTALALLWIGPWHGNPVLWLREWPHELGTLGLTAAITQLANRTWAKADLGRILRERDTAIQRNRNSWHD